MQDDDNIYTKMRASSYLSAGNASYVEDLYECYLEDPNQVTSQWRDYFSGLSDGMTAAPPDVSHQSIREALTELARRPRGFSALGEQARTAHAKQELVDSLITAYRRFGHLNANINPLGFDIPLDRRLTLDYHDLTSGDLHETFLTRGLLAQPHATLQAIYDALRRCYCGTVGIEYSRIANEQEREWLCDYAEHRLPNLQHAPETQRNILLKLIAANTLEKYLESRFPGQKRFSIEGSDSLIPLLDELAKRARLIKTHELVIGMAHRGRLNVLINIMGKPAAELFAEFEGTKEIGLTTGDVKYHMGYSADVETTAGPMHLSLAFNPSHLEFINAVVQGSVRARQEREHV